MINKVRLSKYFFLIVLLFLSGVLGYRSIEVGIDTINYMGIFLSRESCNCIGGLEPGFEFFIYPMALLGFSSEAIFTVISLFIFIITFLIIHKLVEYYFLDIKTRSFKIKLTVFFIFLFLPFYFQIHVNAIRQGMSLLILLLAFTYVLNKNYSASFWLALISIGFHYSAVLIVPFYLVFFHSKIEANKKFLISMFVFLCLVVVYATGFSEYIIKSFSFFTGLPIWSAVSQYAHESSYKAGVRYDFLAFTFLVIAPVAFFAIKKESFKDLSVFLFLSTFPFLLLGWGAYSNRYIFNTWIYAFIFLILLLVIRLPKLSKVPYFFGVLSVMIIFYKVYF